MSLRSAAEAFFSDLRRTPPAREPIARYPLDLQLVTPDETVVVRLRDGQLVEVAAGPEPTHYWTLDLHADRETFGKILSGRSTLGEAFYAGRLFAPEEKSKHNLVCALGSTVRLLQEALRRSENSGQAGAEPPTA